MTEKQPYWDPSQRKRLEGHYWDTIKCPFGLTPRQSGKARDEDENEVCENCAQFDGDYCDYFRNLAVMTLSNGKKFNCWGYKIIVVSKASEVET